MILKHLFERHERLPIRHSVVLVLILSSISWLIVLAVLEFLWRHI